MHRLEQLLGDVMEQATGQRRPAYAQEDGRTEMEQASSRMAEGLLRRSGETIDTFRAECVALKDAVLVLDADVIERIADVLKQEMMRGIPPTKLAAHISDFVRPATDMACVMAYALLASIGHGSHPTALEATRSLVVKACDLISGYPQEISNKIKREMGRNIYAAIDADDISTAFESGLRAFFRRALLERPAFVAKISAMQYCPAHGRAGAFAGLAFDLLMAAYKDVFERVAAGKDRIEPQVIDRIRSGAISSLE